MSQLVTKARSNYFEVADETEFKKWCTIRGLTAIAKPNGLFAIYPTDDDGWPAWETPANEDDDSLQPEIDFPIEVSKQLAEGNIAVLRSVWYEKLCYLGGESVAVSADGTIWVVDLEQIENVVHEAGVSSTNSLSVDN